MQGVIGMYTMQNRSKRKVSFLKTVIKFQNSQWNGLRRGKKPNRPILVGKRETHHYRAQEGFIYRNKFEGRS